MAEEKKGFLSKAGDFISEKLTGMLGEKNAERVKAGARLAATITVAYYVLPHYIIGGTVAALIGVGRAAYGKPVWEPVKNFISSTIGDVGTLVTGVKEVAAKVDAAMDDGKPAPEAGEDALKGKGPQGPFNGGPTSKPSNDLGGPGVKFQGPRNVA